MNVPTAWIHALEGGVLLGISTSLLLACNGRVAGISGIFGGVLLPKTGDFAWRIMFLLGLVLGGGAALLLWPSAFGVARGGLGVALVAGALVGYGTRLGNGCTSGHGVCGLSRGSQRSLAATLTFMTTGALTVALTGAN